ncbi:sialidase family protein [Fodinicola feengrottensis]|uniref:sialidase family protein n=1 Tax=Fodinicola feengrottensis TaxID=435914 RepID=UPI0013D551B0|nr:sialidase family protein [Fodinicola feengrottensis]
MSSQVSYLALRTGSCARGPLVLARTSDGGRTWHAHSVPDATASGAVNQGSPILPLDENTLVANGFISHDGGETWQPQKLDGSVQAAPVGWIVLPADSFSHQIKPKDPHALAALDPTTGQAHFLANQPADHGDGESEGVTQATDGSLWTVPGYQGTGVAVSHDRGRTWSTFAPPDRKGSSWVSSTSVDGRIGYAIFGTDSAAGKPAAIYRTDDGGINWRSWTTAAPSLVSFHLLANGDLMGVDRTYEIGGPLVVSKDQGHTFVARSPATEVFSLIEKRVTGVYFAEGFRGRPPNNWTEIYDPVSSDGETYQSMTYPSGVSWDLN